MSMTTVCSSPPSVHAAGAFPSVVLPVGVGAAVFSSLHAARSLSPTLVRIPSSSPPFPRISLRLDSRQTAAFRRRLEPVLQARRRSTCGSNFDLAFYPEKFAVALALLQALPDVRARCRQIERYGKELPLPSAVPSFVSVASRVEGLPAIYNTCVRARLDPANRSQVLFDARSAAPHIRGLAAILIAGLSGSPVRAVASMSLAPFELLIGQSLLPARWCGHFMLLLEHMQSRAREIVTSTGVDYYNTNLNVVLSIMGLGRPARWCSQFMRKARELIASADVNDVLSISLKDEIEETHVVHELLDALGTYTDHDDDDHDDHDGDRDDDDDDDHVRVDREGGKCDEDSFDYDRDQGGKYGEDDGWRVKRYPPQPLYFEDGNENISVSSSTPLRWG